MVDNDGIAGGAVTGGPADALAEIGLRVGGEGLGGLESAMALPPAGS